MVVGARISAAILVGLCLGSIVGPASAQTTNPAGRTFVARLGSDTGICAREQPCRTFAFAMGPTPVGGEIVALDHGGDYGPVTITKALTITGPGKGTGGAKIAGPSSGYAIEINAPNAVVNLRGIEINGGQNAIHVAAAASVDIADVVTTGQAQSGLIVQAPNVTVRNSTFQGSQINIQIYGATVLKGVRALNASFQDIYLGGVTSVIEDCLIANTTRSDQAAQHGVGLFLDYATTAFVKNSTIANSVGHGVYMGGGTTLTLDTTTITGSGGYGVHYDGSSSTSRSRAQAGKSTSVRANVLPVGATVNSYGNNNIVGNTSGVSDITLTPVSTN